MNNKQLGTAFEKEFCDILKEYGFWVHFCSPNAQGAQPCDIIAVKDGQAYLIDCKTSSKDIFTMLRIEDNQIFAFGHWCKCGNSNTYIAVKFNDKIYMLPFMEFYKNGKMKLNEEYFFENWIGGDR